MKTYASGLAVLPAVYTSKSKAIEAIKSGGREEGYELVINQSNLKQIRFYCEKYGGRLDNRRQASISTGIRQPSTKSKDYEYRLLVRRRRVDYNRDSTPVY